MASELESSLITPEVPDILYSLFNQVQTPACKRNPLPQITDNFNCCNAQTTPSRIICLRDQIRGPFSCPFYTYLVNQEYQNIG